MFCPNCGIECKQTNYCVRCGADLRMAGSPLQKQLDGSQNVYKELRPTGIPGGACVLAPLGLIGIYGVNVIGSTLGSTLVDKGNYRHGFASSFLFAFKLLRSDAHMLGVHSVKV